MLDESNHIKIINVSGSVDILTELVDKTDNLASKFKGIFLKYNHGNNQYDFVDEVFFFAPLQPENKDSQIGSLITLDIPITKVIQPFGPDSNDPDRNKLEKIIVHCDCEYMRDGNKIYESQYEIVLA